MLNSFLNQRFSTNFNYSNTIGNKSPGLQGITAETIWGQGPLQRSSYKSQVISSLWVCLPSSTAQGRRSKARNSSSAAKVPVFRTGYPKGGRNRTTHVPSRPFEHIVQATIQAGDIKITFEHSCHLWVQILQESETYGSTDSSLPHYAHAQGFAASSIL